jgi:hypothetical protein
MASQDGSEVATPASLMEWFLHYYREAAALGPIECITRPGDLLFVPSGWWHLVLNLEPHTIAVTQNYVSRGNLPLVLDFLRNKKDQISGVPCDKADALAERFEEVLRRQMPQVLEEAEREMLRMHADRKRKRMRGDEDGAQGEIESASRVKFWDSTKAEQEDEAFAFDFGKDDDDEETEAACDAQR